MRYERNQVEHYCLWFVFHFLMHFFRGLILKKVGVSSRCKKSSACKEVKGFLGASSGDHHRANFRLKCGGGHILHVWSLSSRRKSDQKTGHVGNHASYALLRLSCSGYIECKACPFWGVDDGRPTMTGSLADYLFCALEKGRKVASSSFWFKKANTKIAMFAITFTLFLK